jgi:hypothetical protein
METLMIRRLGLAFLFLFLAGLPACKKSGNNYRVNFKVLRQNTLPAEGFRVDLWVQGKSEPRTKPTDAKGMVVFDDLPTPDAQHQLNAILHYYNGKKDQSREISYPFIPSDAKRLNDTQYSPNNATPEPEEVK